MIDNNIRYLIEDIINFNPADYSNDDSDLIGHDDIDRFTISPLNLKQLKNLIRERLKENPKEPYLLDIDVSFVKSMKDLFSEIEFRTIEILNLSTWRFHNVINMKYMFCGLSKLRELKLPKNINTSNVKNMSFMFDGCKQLKSLDLSGFDTSNVTDMCLMFNGCQGLETLDLSSFDTSNVKNMDGMFSCCVSLPELDLSNFDTSNVTDMTGMFLFCRSLTELDLSNFQTYNVTSMREMFASCKLLNKLDLSNFSTISISNPVNIRSMFLDDHELIDLITNDKMILEKYEQKC